MPKIARTRTIRPLTTGNFKSLGLALVQASEEFGVNIKEVKPLPTGELVVIFNDDQSTQITLDDYAVFLSRVRELERAQ